MMIYRRWLFGLIGLLTFMESQLQCIYENACISQTDRGHYYRGYKNSTEKGEECLYWSSHPYDVNPSKYPDEGLEKNYCRNPLGSGMKPWCYTKVLDGNSTNLEQRADYWGFCDIPPCDPCYFRGIQFKQGDAFHNGCSQCICIADGFRCYNCPTEATSGNSTDFACYTKENARAKFPACCKRRVCHGRDEDFNFDEYVQFLRHKLDD